MLGDEDLKLRLHFLRVVQPQFCFPALLRGTRAYHSRQKRKLLDDAEDAIINALNIIEVVKIEWAAENAWSEYDQSVKDKCGAVLFKIDAVKKNYPAMWPSK